MFESCSSLTVLNLSNFKNKLVNDIQGVVQNCTKLTHLYLENLEGNITKCYGAFSKCYSLEYINISKLNMDYALYVDYLFSDCHFLN